MIVRVKLFGELRDAKPAPEGTHVVDVPVSCSVREVLDYMRIDPAKPKIILANGAHVELDHELRDGDVLSIFPPVGGG